MRRFERRGQRRVRTTASVRRRYSWLTSFWKWSTVVGIVLVVGWIGWGWQQLNSLVEPMRAANNTHGFVVHEDGDWWRLLVVDQSRERGLKGLSVISWQKELKELSILRLPENMSDGQVLAQRYWSAGYYRELQQVVEHQIGLPLTGYVVVNESGSQGKRSWGKVLMGEEKSSWMEKTIGLPWWLGQYEVAASSMEPWDFFNLIRHVQVVDLNNSILSFEAEDLLNDKSGTSLRIERTDQKVADLINKAGYGDLSQSIEIKNATSVAGLAALMGRYVKVMGGEVVATVAADAPQSESLLICEEETPFTQELSRLLGIPAKVQEKTGRERSDIELILGEDVIYRLGMN